MFEALGWDVHNKQGYAERYKDVVHEDQVKIGQATKAPDYSFRVGGTRKFFVETKKPSVNLKDDISPAFQVRRYAWSAKLPLSILTDFEEFAIYDCRTRPNKKDKAATARITYFNYSEYVERWDEIAEVFSKEAVLQGSFDRYAEDTTGKRGTQEVDKAFLEELERWRELLAKNFAKRNAGIGVHELNFAVQRTIDRLIFLRIAEDRGLEAYERLNGIVGVENTYGELGKLFSAADDRYNSGLFHFKVEKERPGQPDDFTLNLKLDDKVLGDIIPKLYYPDSPYEFSVLPADILGQVYEQFLGKVIRLTDSGRAKVEEKPEVRKAGGVYYTPTYIVDYIVENTVGMLLDGKTRQQAAALRILDPACGSGSFLLGAYQHLLDWHLDLYINDEPEGHAKGRPPRLYQDETGEWRLTIEERKRILLDNIYGVDIDPQAVEVTKLSLLLKVLEGEQRQQAEMFQERVLPDLGNNIKCGNSLIGPDFYEGQQMALFDAEERRRINVFDWQDEFADIMGAGGFDAVIGNPPYDVLEKDRGESSWPHSTLRDYIKIQKKYDPALGGKLNIYRFFIVRSLVLLKELGKFGMIVPLSIIADISTSRLRQFLMTSTNNTMADCFPQKDVASKRVFESAKLSTVIVTADKELQDEEHSKMQIRVYPWNSFDDERKEATIYLNETKLLDPKNTPIPLVDEEDWKLCINIHSRENVSRLEGFSDFNVTRGEINQTVYRRFIKGDDRLSRMVKGVEVGRYRENIKLSQGHREWFNESDYIKEKREYKPIIDEIRIATQRITGVDERLRVVASIISPKAYFADSTNSITLKRNSNYSLNYLLGFLNSKTIQWRFKITSTNNNVGTNELVSLPLVAIDFSNPTEAAQHERMVSLVESMLALHKELAAARTPQQQSALQRQVDATDRQIDQLVYELYGLTEDEIRIVEES